METSNKLIIYSKSVNSSYNFLFISFFLVLIYTFFRNKFSFILSSILKYFIIGLLLYASFIILKNNSSYLFELKHGIFKNENRNLRNSILYTSILMIFVLILMYHFIYY